MTAVDELYAAALLFLWVGFVIALLAMQCMPVKSQFSSSGGSCFTMELVTHNHYL